METISKSKNIYLYNMLNSLKTDFDKEYTYLISRLISLEYEILSDKLSYNKIAENLLNVINSCDAFPHVDRVCFAVSSPVSSNLKVLSSFNSDSLAQNSMTESYSCFVSAKSSLFKINKTDIRSYGDIEAICSQYSNQLVQRSLARLKKMGVKSGITISLPISDSVSGFLFLNSRLKDHFNDLNPQDNHLLCLLKLLGIHCLNKFVQSSLGVDSNLLNFIKHGFEKDNRFDESLLGRMIKDSILFKTGKEITVEIARAQADSAFLVDQMNVTYLLVKFLEINGSLQNCNKLNLKFDIDKSRNKMLLIVSGVHLNSNHDQYSLSLFNFSGFVPRYEGQNLILETNLEMMNASIDYSL